MRNEVKVGILTVVTGVLFVWGYFFLKGRNLLSRDKIVYVEYGNVNLLTTSSPVLLNGAEIGVVSTITLHPTDVKKMIVGLTLKRDLPIPKDAIATLIPTGLTGGKAIELTFNKPCSGPDCVEYGDYLVGKKQSMLGSYLEPGEIDIYMERIKNGIGGVTDSLNAAINDPNSANGLGKTFKNIEQTVKNLQEATLSLSKLVNKQQSAISNTMNNLESTSNNLAKNNAVITEILGNTNSFSKKLSNTDLDGTVNTAKGAIASLQKTVTSTDLAIKDVNALIAGVNRGEGSLGSLLKDDKLSKNLEKASKDLDLMLQDMRLNPRRYINLSIFGKNGKMNYEYPNGDPANEARKN